MPLWFGAPQAPDGASSCGWQRLRPVRACGRWLAWPFGREPTSRCFLRSAGGGAGWLAWSSFRCFGWWYVPITAFQLAPLAWRDVGADVSAHAIITGLGGLAVLRPGIRNPNGKTTEEQPSQDSTFHQAPSFALSASLGGSLGRPSVGAQWNQSGMRWNESSSPIQTLVPSASGGGLPWPAWKPRNW